MAATIIPFEKYLQTLELAFQKADNRYDSLKKSKYCEILKQYIKDDKTVQKYADCLLKSPDRFVINVENAAELENQLASVPKPPRVSVLGVISPTSNPKWNEEIIRTQTFDFFLQKLRIHGATCSIQNSIVRTCSEVKEAIDYFFSFTPQGISSVVVFIGHGIPSGFVLQDQQGKESWVARDDLKKWIQDALEMKWADDVGFQLPNSPVHIIFAECHGHLGRENAEHYPNLNVKSVAKEQSEITITVYDGDAESWYQIELNEMGEELANMMHGNIDVNQSSTQDEPME